MCIRSCAIKADGFASQLDRAYQADSNDMLDRQITRLEIMHELIVGSAEAGVDWFLGLVVFLLLSVLWARRRRNLNGATVKADPAGSEPGNARDGHGRP